MIELSFHWHGETEKAIKVSENGQEDKLIWLPKSQIQYERNKEEVTVQCPEWLATKCGLI